MKMSKKVREYKSGDFIFAKVKGYPAWPARVQRPNGKKYFVYFYGTGETANLPPNMIFDYAENKEKFLTKTVKRRDFNDGVKQIEYDFANNVPLEQVIGVPVEAPANDTTVDTTMDESVADTTANDTVTDDANATQNETAVEDSDDAGALVIDEGKTPAKGRKSKAEAKPKETPKGKEPKTPRGKAKKEDSKEKEEESEEIVSRSGRKIRPKRYIDEQTEDNATLPSPAPKRRRGASPAPEKEKPDVPKETVKEKEKDKDEKSVSQFNVVKQSELEGLKEAFKPADEDKDNILIAYLPNGSYAGIRLFQSRPRSFKNEAARLQWDKQAARNALTLKMQLEREHITPQSMQGQLILDLNLTDEEKAALDKERETEEKKSRVNFLKTEMKLIELDAKIKTCLCLEKADTELCLKLLDELLALEVKPLMLLKHPTCLETVKRMRAYVGNTPSWDLNETDALAFSKQAHKIRKKADLLYKNMKEHFETPEGLSFWEYFSERVLMFKKVTASLTANELLELVHDPPELSQPSAHTMRAAIEEANNTVPPVPKSPEVDDEDEKQVKKKATPAKAKKPPPTPTKSKRTRGKKDEEAGSEAQKPEESAEKQKEAEENGEVESSKEMIADGTDETKNETPKDPESTAKNTNEDVEMAEPEKADDSEQNQVDIEKEKEKPDSEPEKKVKEKPTKETEKPKRDKKASEKSDVDSSKDGESDKKEDKKKSAKNGKDTEKSESEKSAVESDKSGNQSEKAKEVSEEKSETKDAKADDKDNGEPRAKRSRESKKTEPPPPRSPAKRKSKF